jgi:predicted DsbA family dithiol-disulfide isomerase
VALFRVAEEMGLWVFNTALELNPAPGPLPYDSLAERVEAALPLARELGVELRTPKVIPRTRKAHEVAWHATQNERQWPMREAIYRAYFAEGRDIGRIDVLAELAAGVGLDHTEARVVLDVDRYTQEIVEQTEVAARQEMRATPKLLVLDEGPTRVHTGALSIAELRGILLAT